MSYRNWSRLVLLLVLSCWLTLDGSAQVIRYVKQGGSGDGSSWANASSDLQAMIDATGVEQVWVASGRYTRTSGGSSFVMKNNVAVYGGFVGSETSLAARPAVNPVGGQLSSTTLTVGSGGGRVIENNNNELTATAQLYGVVITGGSSSDFGGGIYNRSSSPSFTNCTITNNTATSGGGIYNIGSNSLFTNCAITNNTATNGGGIHNAGSSPSFANCAITNNTAPNGVGGGITNRSSTSTLINCLLAANSANLGGAMRNDFSSRPQLTNCTLTANRAGAGAALINYESSQPQLTNCILWDNQETANTSINNDNGTGVTASYCLIGSGENDFTGANNLVATVSPFVSTTDFRLRAGSPAIDAGDPASTTATSGTTALAGNPRFFQNGRIDIGAYEDQTPSSPIRYVKATASGSGDGSSWANASSDLQTMIDTRGVQQVWVAGGRYTRTSGGSSFEMKNGVAIYGGFVGSETNLSQRPGVNPVTGQLSSTTLTVGSGGGSVIYNYDNGLTATAHLDGVVITGGSAGFGGGIANLGSSPSFANCAITNNTATDATSGGGGGVYNFAGSPRFTNCAITNNTATGGSGGGFYNIANSSPTLTNCLLAGNSANLGGAMRNNNSSTPRLTNCTLTANRAGAGAALINYQSSQPQLTNCILWDNQEAANTSINNDTGTGVTASYCLIGSGENDFTGTNNLTATVSPFVSDTDFRLRSGSVAIDAGDPNSTTATSGTTDLAGNPRFFQNGRIDIGAYEDQTPPPLPIRYVKATASGSGDGSSWANASGDLQAMINAQGVQQVWVASGRYTRTSGGSSFEMKNGVAIYGGFVGTESSLAARPAVNPVEGQLSSTTLTVGSAGGSVIDNTNNGLTATARLDGVVIAGGTSGNGGGIYNRGSSPTITNCAINNNTATDDYGDGNGGGIYNSSSSPTLTNCAINNNTANGNYGGSGGGGIYNSDSSNPTLINCLLAGNSANLGGAMRNNNSSRPRLTNCTLTANRAGAGAALINYSGSQPQLINCILWNNQERDGSSINNDNGTGVTASYCLIGSGENDFTSSGPTNLTATSSPFVSNTDYRLNACSAAINAGDPASTSATSGTTDLAGQPRFYQGGRIDIGAYEYQGSPSQPVAITQQPANASSVQAGASVTVAVSVSGTVTSYQWYKDNLSSAVSGQTSATLTLTNVQPADAGSYSLVVSGACNSVTSTAFSLSVSAPSQPIRYVKQGGTGDGSSWTNASGDLQAMINATGVEQVWVAQGTYKPTGTSAVSSSARDLSFVMKNGVTIYGGFVGNETGLSQRPVVNPVTGNPSSSTLSGDIGAVGDNTDNSYHVIRNPSSLTTSAVLDGFVITAGVATGAFPDNRGGGMYNTGGSPSVDNCLFVANQADFGGGIFNLGQANLTTTPSLTDCSFQRNTATSSGGAVYNLGVPGGTNNPQLTNCNFQDNTAQNGGAVGSNSSNPSLTTCSFTQNRAAAFGGGMYNVRSSNPGLTNCSFTQNIGSDGGAITNNNSNPSLTTCSFTQNRAAVFGGGMYNVGSNPGLTNCSFTQNVGSDGGGMYSSASAPSLINCKFDQNQATDFGGGINNVAGSNPTLINCSFSKNTSGTGGGIYNVDSSSPRLTNCSFSQNTATTGTGGAIRNRNQCNPILANTILWNNGGQNALVSEDNSAVTANYCLIEAGETDVTGTNNLTAIRSPFLSDTDLRLTSCAPAINAGNNADNTTSTDLAGQTRVYGPRIDMGAYEYQDAPTPLVAITNQPASASSVQAGASVTVPVSVSGSVSAYQWYKDNLSNAVSGQTSATLSLGNVQLSDAGSYSLVASSRECSSVRSAAFTLSVSPAVTGAPNLVTPATGTTTNGLPVFSGTAPDGSTVRVVVSGVISQTLTTAATNGAFSVTASGPLTSGSYFAYADAQLSGQATSPASNTSSFTVDATAPTVRLVSSAGASGSTTTTSPFAFSAIFSEAVTGFSAAGIAVSNGSVSSVPAGSGAGPYAFQVTPTVTGQPTSVSVVTGAAQDGVGNPSQASTGYVLTYQLPATNQPTLTSPANGTTTNGQPTFSGTAPASSVVTVTVLDGAGAPVRTLTITASSPTSSTLGSFSVSLPADQALASGAYSVFAQAQLPGQQISSGSPRISFTVDATVASVSISPSSATLTCASPTVSLTAVGTGTVRWSTGSTDRTISVSSAGIYSVTLTAPNGSTASASANVTADQTAPSLTINPSSATLTCASPTVSLTAVGTGTVRWNTGSTDPVISVSSAGVYSVTLTSPSGCTTSASVSVTADQTAPSLTITPSSATLTCSSPTASLTAVGSGTYRWSTGSTDQTISVSSAGIYSVTLTSPSGCTTSASVSVTADQTAFSLSLTSNGPLACAPGSSVTLTASGAPAGASFRFSSGATQVGATNAATVTTAGAYSVTATAPNGCLATATATVTSANCGFAISGVTTIRCETVNVARGEQRVSFTPQYTGLTGEPLSFSVVNELGSTTAAGPYTLRLYTDNPVITLVAQQGSATTSFRYNWLAGCNGSTPPVDSLNTPPVVVSPIGGQTATVGQPFSYVIPAGTFSDAQTPTQLTLSVAGLPAGLVFTAPSTISGTPSVSGTSPVTVTATDPGGLSASTSFVLTVQGSEVVVPPSGFALSGVTTIRCETVDAARGERRVSFMPQYTGLTGEPVSFSIVNELGSTMAAGPYTLRLYSDNPVITLVAQQGGVSTTYRYNWLNGCGSSQGRVGVPTESPMQVRVLGNPLTSPDVTVEIRGAAGKPLELSVTDMTGRTRAYQRVDQASSVEVHTMPLKSGAGGLLLLQVRTPSQSQTIKLIQQ
jgi:hypothetical protein